VNGVLKEGIGFRHTGYLEFCINDRVLAADPTNYFRLFWRFSRYLHETSFPHEVFVNWELLGATFIEAGGCNGMTCWIVINTAWHETEKASYDIWATTLDVVGDVLCEVPAGVRNPIY